MQGGKLFAAGLLGLMLVLASSTSYAGCNDKKAKADCDQTVEDGKGKGKETAQEKGKSTASQSSTTEKSTKKKSSEKKPAPSWSMDTGTY